MCNALIRMSITMDLLPYSKSEIDYRISSLDNTYWIVDSASSSVLCLCQDPEAYQLMIIEPFLSIYVTPVI